MVFTQVWPGLSRAVGKSGWLGASGKVPGSRADGVALAIGAIALAEESPVHEVAGIELDARRGDAHFQHPARARFLDARGRAQCAGGAVHDEIVIIAAAKADLLVAGIADARANRRRFAEIERRAGHGAAFTGGNQGGDPPG